MTPIEIKCNDEALKIADELLKEYEEDYRRMADNENGFISKNGNRAGNDVSHPDPEVNMN